MKVWIGPTAISVEEDGASCRYLHADVHVTDRWAQHARIELRDERVVFFEDAAAVRALDVHGYSRTGRIARWPRRRRLLIGVVLLAALLVGFFGFALEPLAGVAVRLVPAETEATLGREVYRNYLAAHPVLDDPPAVAALEKCAAALRPAGIESLAITVVEDPTQNAFALPGGYIVVFRGLLDQMQGENELLGVLAHEAGHVAQRHGLKRIARAAMLGIVLSAALGDASGLGSVLLDNSSLLLSLAYDRREESQADAFATALLRQRGLDTSGLATLFERLETQEGWSGLPALLSTHPAPAERIASLRRDVAPAGAPATVLSSEEWRLLKREGA